MAIGAVGALAAIGVILFLSRPSSKLLASFCEARSCHHGVTRSFGAAQPPAGAPAATHRAVRPNHLAATAPPYTWPGGAQPVPNPTSSAPGPQPTKPSSKPTSPGPSPTTTAPSPSPTSTPTPTSTATPSPTPQSAQVSYTVVDQWGDGDGGFHGRFTIVNTGTTAIDGWELAVDLAGDQIRSVWDGSFHTTNGTLYIDPSSSQQTIAPGATITEDFIANGSTTAPTSCAFNGSTC